MSEAADIILAALNVAPDEPARAALLASCPSNLLKQVHGTLWYRKMVADIAEQCAAERAAFSVFLSELDAAPDDAARLQLIEAAGRDPQRGRAFVAEWVWRRTASAGDWLHRYVAMLGAT